MSERYPGGFITKTPVVPTPSSASGVWTLDQQLQAQKSGTWPFGGPFTYIEDVFSTYLYTGTGATQTITNGIDLSGKGGLVWYKSRSDATDHELVDTVRGGTKYIQSNSTSGQGTLTSTEQLSFSSTGFSIGGSNFNGNQSGKTYASWTFRKQPQFFDVVTYTGTGVNGRAVAHNLGATPGCIIVKKTSASNDWRVYHRSLGTPAYNYFMSLNTTQAKFDTATATMWTAAPTSTNFYVSDQSEVNENGATYVAYLFAHDAGGFGLTGTDNVITCGSYTGDGGAGTTNITLGYEPQWIMSKRTDAAGNWVILDVMRGLTVTASDVILQPNTANAEGAAADYYDPTATGFKTTTSSNQNVSGATYIYIAIRRGPMKTPTSGTSVFSPVAYTGNGTTNALTGIGFPPDLMITKGRSASSANEGVTRDRLRGTNPALRTTTTNAESSTTTNGLLSYDMGGVTLGADNTGTDVNGQTNTSGNTYVNWLFRRAPSYFDVVCYTGTGVARTVTHNLGVAPEMMIVKSRGTVFDWPVYHIGSFSPAAADGTRLYLNTTAAKASFGGWGNTAPTATVFTVGANTGTNGSGTNYVAYLFASCPGVSKVGSYTGTGTTKQIDCGFTAGARFVLIKRTDSTGDWYVWDSARGIVAGNDPYLLLNSTAAEVTSTDYVDTYSAGFEISSTAPAAINANGGTYIFLAIA